MGGVEPIHESALQKRRPRSLYLQFMNRRSIRLLQYDYSTPGSYFITTCTYDRRCLLGRIERSEILLSPQGKIVSTHWRNIARYYPNASLDAFQVMPNHVHAVIVIHSEAPTHLEPIHESALPLAHELSYVQSPVNPFRLPSLLDMLSHEQWKKARRQMLLSSIIGRLKMQTAKAINTLQASPGTAFWQEDYYEHIIRGQHELQAIRKYIAQNPDNWGDDPENPYCGCP